MPDTMATPATATPRDLRIFAAAAGFGEGIPIRSFTCRNGE